MQSIPLHKCVVSLIRLLNLLDIVVSCFLLQLVLNHCYLPILVSFTLSYSHHSPVCCTDVENYRFFNSSTKLGYQLKTSSGAQIDMYQWISSNLCISKSADSTRVSFVLDSTLTLVCITLARC